MSQQSRRQFIAQTLAGGLMLPNSKADDLDFQKLLRPIPLTAKFELPDYYVWCGTLTRGDDGKYRAIVKDNEGYFTNAGKSLALFESADGLDWKLSAHPLVATMEVQWANGAKQKMNSLERPQLWLEKGKPAVLLCAADVSPAREYSFNVQIPLRF
jgi:hypothetical protein